MSNNDATAAAEIQQPQIVGLPVILAQWGKVAVLFTEIAKASIIGALCATGLYFVYGDLKEEKAKTDALHAETAAKTEALNASHIAMLKEMLIDQKAQTQLFSQIAAANTAQSLNTQEKLTALERVIDSFRTDFFRMRNLLPPKGE